MKTMILVTASDILTDNFIEFDKGAGQLLFTTIEKANDYINLFLSSNHLWVVSINCWDGLEEPEVNRELTIKGKYLEETWIRTEEIEIIA